MLTIEKQNATQQATLTDTATVSRQQPKLLDRMREALRAFFICSPKRWFVPQKLRDRCILHPLHPPLQKQQLPRRHRGIATESSAGIRVGRRVGGTRSSVGGGVIRLAGGVGKGGQLDATKVGLPAQPARAVQAAKISRALRIGRLRVGGDGGLLAHRDARAGFGGFALGGDPGGELGMIGGAVLHALDPSRAEQRGGEERQGQQAVGPGNQAGHTIPGV